ncbi:MAG: hypothetical protein RR387_05270, partial [Clostridiales bacterium]
MSSDFVRQLRNLGTKENKTENDLVYRLRHLDEQQKPVPERPGSGGSSRDSALLRPSASAVPGEAYNRNAESNPLSVKKAMQSSQSYDRPHERTYERTDISSLRNQWADEKLDRRIQEYDELRYGDTFGGQFQPNYGLGDLQMDSNEAWAEYVADPNERNKQRAQKIDGTIQRFYANNTEALDEENMRASWISKSLAGYLPQLKDQTKASAIGALSGGVAGSSIPGIGTAVGANVGYVVAQGAYSYKIAKGAAFKSLIDAGVDKETALAAAKDEGLLSALTEMADAGVDIATLGFGKLIKTGVKTFAKAGMEKAAESGWKKFTKALGGYGLNVMGEPIQEGLQQGISIANRERALSGEAPSIFGLAEDTLHTTANALTSKTPENAANRQEILDAAKEGAKIAAMVGGGTLVINEALSRSLQPKNDIVKAGYSEEVAERALDSGGIKEKEDSRFAGAQTHTPEQQQVMNEFASSTDNRIIEFVNKVRNLADKRVAEKIRMPIANVNKKAVNDIKSLTGIETSDYTVSIKGDAVVHIDNRHGENGQQDQSMADINNIARIPYVLDNYDTIEVLTDPKGNPVFDYRNVNSDGSPSVMLQLTKRIDGT